MKIIFIVITSIVAIQISVFSQEKEQTNNASSADFTNRVSNVLSAEDKAILLKQAGVVQTAVNQWDFDEMIKHEHPAVYKLYGKDAFEQASRAAMSLSEKS